VKVALSVKDFLDRGESVYRERIAVVDEPDQPASSLGSLTFDQLAERARANAAGLDALGVDAGARIAVVSPNAARMVSAFFGVAGYGRVLVPINFRLSATEVSYIVDQCGADVLLVDPELDEALSTVTAKHRFVIGDEADEALHAYGAEPRGWEPDEDATAFINYTSGTTARPKGVQLTHRNVWLNSSTFGWQTGVNDRDVYLHTLPMFHVNGWGMPFATAGMGVAQVVLRKVDGSEILRRVDEHGVTLLCGAPAVVNAVLDAAASWDGPIPGRDEVRIVVAGAPPPTRTVERVMSELGWEFIQIYGLTETSPLLTMNRMRYEWDDLDNAARATKLVRAGAPVLGVRLTTDREGEVLAHTNHALEGYWEQPDATAAAIVDGWFHTGDGGYIDDDGYLTISDRKKDVIISGGENVSSVEVEDVLFSHDGVAEVAVIGVPDQKWGETVKALVVRAPGAADLEESELIEHCRERLAHYKCPTTIEFRDELARTATGKLQKFKLRAPYWEGRERQVN
jgi:acyl-CoA synthetase (AMP-forming)/AMP-acid ligase II